MSERAAIERVEAPVTVTSLVEDLRALGVEARTTLLVHASLSELGWVPGGAQAVVEALQNVVTDSGTLVVPTHTPQYTDPEGWSHPPVPEGWVETIREAMPPYRPSVTPTRGVGAIPECLRTLPGARRSRHPVMSFAAWGDDAGAVVADHGYDRSLGEASPLADIYDRDGDVLLLGVGHEVNTSLHLAEYCADFPTETTRESAPVLKGGRRTTVEYEDLVTRMDDFPDLGAAFERRVGAATGTVGAADATLASQRELVDFGVEWLETNR